MSDAPVQMLVADGDPANRAWLMAHLGAMGYSALEAPDAESALALARERLPAVLITELVARLPDGTRLIDAVRALPGAGGLPVLVLTAAIDVAERDGGMGGDDSWLSGTRFLTKPLNEGMLRERVNALLERDGGSGALPVLVVDDDLANLELIERRLEVEDYRVVLASTGSEGLQRASEQPFQAVLLDLRLPDMSGLEVLAQLHQRTPELPVLIMTAHGSEALAVRALTEGAADYLIKPLARREMVAALRNAVERARLQREKRGVQRDLFEAVLALQEGLAATERSRRRMEGLLETLDEGVLLTDEQGRIEWLNRVGAEMLRVPAGLTDMRELLAPVVEVRREDGSHVTLSPALFAGTFQDSEYLVRWADGVERVFLLSAKAVPSSGALEGGRLVVFRDNTARHQRRVKLEALLQSMTDEVQQAHAERQEAVEQASAAAERVKNDILAAVSHELRTPLNFIVGFGSVLADGVAGELTPEQQRLVDKMLAGAERLTGTVEDLLNFAMLTSGMLVARAEPLALGPLVEALVEAEQPEARERGLRLMAALDPATRPAQADAGFTRNVLRHLIANAIKFTPEGGDVTVRLAPDPATGGAVLAVADTGIGIEAARIPHLFETFYQVESQATRRFGGTGMGLALVKGLAEQMGARVRVESTPGRGSTFSVVFPPGQEA